jgi:hypothetical protein
MPILSANTDYTDRDFTALLKRFRSLLASVFPKWTDDQKANFGNLLAEWPNFVGDVLGFYQDNQAAESRITTATQMRNMIALVKLMGYQPRSPRAAQTYLTITLSAPVAAGRTVTFTPPWQGLANPLTGSTDDTANPVAFELQAPIVITGPASSGAGSVKNSRRIGNPDDLAHDPGFAFISTGLPNQTYQLSEGPYLDGSAVLQDDVGALTMADSNSLVTAEPDDRVYRIELDENGLATFIFGDGTSGAVPSGTVRGAYEVGGGTAGNVAHDSLKKFDGQFVDSHGDSVQIDTDLVTHLQVSGGLDAESIESVRENAPLSIQTLSRTVTKDDYENQAILSGMMRALMLTQSENLALKANTAELYCVPMGGNFQAGIIQGGTLSPGQTDDVKANISQKPSSQYPYAKPGIVGYSVTILTAPYVDIGVFARLYLHKSAAPTFEKARAIAAKAAAGIKAYFALLNADGTKNDRVDFGVNLAADSGEGYSTPPSSGAVEVAMSDLSTIVAATAGVREVGDADDDFKLIAYRVLGATDGYTSGTTPATLVQSLQHHDVQLQLTDFPRLKMLTFGGSVPDIVLVDGDNADTYLYPS